MTQMDTLLLDVLGEALFSVPAPLPTQADCTALLQEARAQAVVPLVFDTLDRKGVLSQPLKDVWLPRVFMYMQKNEQLAQEQQQILRWLSQAAIPAVILKGSVSAMAYPNPSLRVMGDIDLLVEPHRQRQAVAALQAYGYGEVADETHPCHFTLRKDGITVEIHKEPNGLFLNSHTAVSEKIRAFLADAVAQRQTEDGLPVPPDDCQAVILILHKMEHFMLGGLGLRQLCDWAAFANKKLTPSLWKQLQPTLAACGLLYFTGIITRACVEHLHLPRERVPWAMAYDKALADEVMARILACGNFGVKEKAYGQRFFTDAHASGRLSSLLRVTMRVARQHWPVCVKHPILLPLAPFVAFGMYLKLRIQGKREALHPLQLYKSAGAKQQLYKELKPFVAEEI